MFRITITEIDPQDPVTTTERYAQTVDRIDMMAVIDAINKPVAPPKKKRSDAGRSRVKKEAQAQ